MKLKHFLSRNVLTGQAPVSKDPGSIPTSGLPSAKGSTTLSTNGSAPPEQLLAALSYEARTALTNIVGSADILSQHRDDMPNDMRDAAGTILQSSRLLLRAVDAVFLLTSLQQSNVDMNMESVEISQVVSQACEHLAQLVAERYVNLQVDNNLTHKWYLTDVRGLGMVLDHIMELLVRQTDQNSVLRMSVSAYVSQVEVGKAGLKFRFIHEGKPLSPHTEYALSTFNNTQAPMARPGVSAGSPYDYLLLAVANRVARLLGGSIQPITGTSGSGLALDLPCVSPADPVFKQESPSGSPIGAKHSPPMPKFMNAAVMQSQVEQDEDLQVQPVLRRASQPPNTRKRSSVSSAATAAATTAHAIRPSPASSQMVPAVGEAPATNAANAGEGTLVGSGKESATAGEPTTPAGSVPPSVVASSFLEAMSVGPMDQPSTCPQPPRGAGDTPSLQGDKQPVAPLATFNQAAQQEPQPRPTTPVAPDTNAAVASGAIASGTATADTNAVPTVLDANGNPQQLWVCPADDVLAPPKKKQDRHVLVVEDDMINQRIIRAMLTKLGYKQITFAADGADALFHYNSMKEEGKYYDIILLDQSLPSLSGDDTCARIRRNDRTQVIISCSANAQLTTDPELCRALGYDEAINKPIYLDLLAEVLNRWTIAGDARRLRHTKRKLKHEAIAAGLAVTPASFAAINPAAAVAAVPTAGGQ